MFDTYILFNWRLKVEARLHEFRKWLQNVRPLFRSKRVIEARLTKQATELELEVNQALFEGRDEDATAAYDKLNEIKMQLVDFPKVSKK